MKKALIDPELVVHHNRTIIEKPIKKFLTFTEKTYKEKRKKMV
jgi:hypothetical protein